MRTSACREERGPRANSRAQPLTARLKKACTRMELQRAQGAGFRHVEAHWHACASCEHALMTCSILDARSHVLTRVEQCWDSLTLRINGKAHNVDALQACDPRTASDGTAAHYDVFDAVLREVGPREGGGGGQ